MEMAATQQLAGALCEWSRTGDAAAEAREDHDAGS